jgi:signal transduction histidine kinase/ligand-binding sensor domain-containing protein
MRARLFFALVASFTLLCDAHRVQGLQPNSRISQYGHMSWRTNQNGLEGTPVVIAQTTDGYIWVGTTAGVFRLDGDGALFTRWVAPAGEEDPGSEINGLFGASDGSLYIGTERTGVYHLSHQHIYHYPESMRWAGGFYQDKQGTVWVGNFFSTTDIGTMCKVGETHLSCLGKKDGLGCLYGLAFVSDRPGSLWVGGSQGICHWRANERPENYLLPSADKTPQYINSIAIDGQGSLWAGLTRSGPGRGLLKFSDGVWKTYRTSSVDGSKFAILSLLGDRNGDLWIGTNDDGVYRLSNGKLDHFDRSDGLSGKDARKIFEDREGTIWVLSGQGLDSFHDLPVITYGTHEGLAESTPYFVAPAPDGDVWVGTLNKLNRFHNQQFEPVNPGPPMGEIGALYRDSQDQLWVSSGRHLYLYRDGKFLVVMDGNRDDIGHVIQMGEDIYHQLWVSVADPTSAEGNRLYRIQGLHVAERFRAPGIAGGGPLDVLVPNVHGGLWVAGENHGLYWFHDGMFEQLKVDGIKDPIEDLAKETDGSLWITSAAGFIRYKDGKTRKFTMPDGLPCESGVSVLDDHAGYHWFFRTCGIVRVPDTELERWWKDPSYLTEETVFNNVDGAHPRMQGNRPIFGTNGQIWAVNGSNVQMIDPARLPFNSMAPPVHIERLLVDHSDKPMSDKVVLPASPRELQIDYTGLSFVVPERVRFRYQLVGHDKDWTEAGTRRQAFYNDLLPGDYTFLVIACNNDGIWNSRGDELKFSIPPAWYQALWFRLTCALAVIGIGYTLYLLRLRQYAASMKMRFDERLEERTRLARDLHDTLLQTIQGTKFVADQAESTVQDPAAKSVLRRISDWLERATCEGRAALESLRSSTTEGNNLAAAFKGVFNDCRIDIHARLELSVNGVSKEMHPIVRDEVYRIGYEAIRNACVHSGASEIRIELTYNQNMTLCVEDNGCGMDQATLDAGKSGHYGLTGMRERAARIGARLSVVSSCKGTQITLTVPGEAIWETSQTHEHVSF